MIRVALIQFDVRPGEVSLNEGFVAEQIDLAARSGAEMIVLPELWNCSYDLANLPRLAQDVHGSSISLLKELAKKHGLFIFAGSIAEKKDDAFYNTTMVIDQKGFVAGKYRKVHLFSMGFAESRYFSPGTEWGLVETPWGRAGVVICYDLRFPELMRNLVLRGAKFVVVPAQWPQVRFDQWRILSTARAIENQVYVIVSNRTGSEGEIIYPGGSFVISPWGDVIREGNGSPGVILADIDLSEVDKVRESWPLLSERRGILDEIDNSQF